MRLPLLWTLGALAGVLGAVVLFDTHPGVNWGIWTAFAMVGLLAYRRPDRTTLRSLAPPLGFAVILAAGAAVTTAPLLLLAIVAIVASLLALALTLARDDTRRLDYGAIAIVTAPFRGLAITCRGAMSAVEESIEAIDTEREHPALRGSLIATPIVLVLALLFASADPVLARGRDAVYDAFGSWSGVPRAIFGVLLAMFVIGAYVAARAAPARADLPQSSATTLGRAGLTERRIAIGAAAAVSWLFVLLQIGYMFGATPDVAGSGMTFAESARRGFGELAIAATGSALLIVAAYQRTQSDDESQLRRGLMLPAVALLAAVGCILVSAFHRVNLYEDAYGYTPMRVYAQAYMMLTLAILVVLAWQVSRSFDVRALAREVMVVALATLTILVFWNGDAWVARANVRRYVRTGKIDFQYLTRGLSPDAYPALVESLPRLPASDQAQLQVGLAHEYARRPMMRREDSWYEWNARRSRARSALSMVSIVAAPAPTR